ncbi:hypothetical protein PPNSA23_26030 [Phyllobacterium phragmitis]|uniref:Uncharacterized protein n=1 Tax=Phyllobacterium phragmitis TaxID=2670329 RepID=A0ABQ0H167_9HYPH
MGGASPAPPLGSDEPEAPVLPRKTPSRAAFPREELRARIKAGREVWDKFLGRALLRPVLPFRNV